MKETNPQKPVRTPQRWVLILAILAQQSIDGLTYPIAKYGLSLIEPFIFAFFRFIISAVVLLGIARTMNSGSTPIEKKDIFKMIKLGIISVVFSKFAFLYGQSLTAAGHGSVIFATAPIWLFIGGIVFFKEKMLVRRTIGITLGLIGVAFIVTSGAVEMGIRYMWGDLIILVSVISWVVYTILCKPLVAKYGVLRVTAYTVAAGSAVYFPFGLFHAVHFNYTAVPPAAWLSVVYVALGLSVGYYLLSNWLVKHMEASRIAVFLNIQPVIASAVAFLFLGETIGWAFIVGWAIVLTGVIITET